MTTIAIVGTGPSAIYALQALLECRLPLQITLFEAGKTAGVGTPYDPQYNSVEMLANIASIEIPPVGMTLLDYLAACADATLQAIGISRATLCEREFYPRIALGAYYRDGLAALVDGASRHGHAVTVLTQCRVVDVVPTATGADVRYVSRRARPLCQHADKVILATGHVVPTSRPLRAQPSIVDSKSSHKRIGILGSSLSAIDVAVSAATARGGFGATGYTPLEAMLYSITMMSRGGRLPEADFFCPLPAEPSEGFTEDVVSAIVEKAEAGTILDRVFERFAAVLAAEDPAYASRIKLNSLSADRFPDAYFAQRDAYSPFEWARINLEEARLNHRNQHIVAWRYAILRSHEAFGTCLDALSDDEMTRFNRGMKRVFTDNYAAVPPRSIDRLLSLHDSGILDLVKLEEGYEIEFDEQTGGSRVMNGGSTLIFDELVDARGQAIAGEDEFPFPTLRIMLKANRDIDGERDGEAVAVDGSYRLVEGINTLRDIWCLSLPFLLGRKPFIQGLTSAAEMGQAAARAIIGDVEIPSEFEETRIGELINTITTTQPIMLADQAVILAPKNA